MLFCLTLQKSTLPPLQFCVQLFCRWCSCVSHSDRDRFQLGTLSHTLNSKATGYLELSDWQTVAPDQSVRNVEVVEEVL